MNPPPRSPTRKSSTYSEILRTLKKQNVGIVFISHKLREVMEICDRYTVLRDGVMVVAKATSGM